jgi:predicted DNA-binding transcriptional regulator AlpA
LLEIPDPNNIPLDQIPAVLAQLGLIGQQLIARLLAGPPAQTAYESDRLIEVGEAALITGLKPDYLYRHKNLPFRVQISAGQVRFSVKKIERWIATKSIAKRV